MVSDTRAAEESLGVADTAAGACSGGRVERRADQSPSRRSHGMCVCACMRVRAYVHACVCKTQESNDTVQMHVKPGICECVVNVSQYLLSPIACQ